MWWYDEKRDLTPSSGVRQIKEIGEKHFCT